MNSKHLRKLIFDYFHQVGSYEEKKKLQKDDKLRCNRCKSLELSFLYDSRRQCHIVRCYDCNYKWLF